MPKYVELSKKYKSQGFKVYSVCTRIEIDKWKEFLKEYGIEDWINVMDPYGRSGFRDNYDIYSTPVSYLLDKDKKILAKRLDPEQIDKMLEKTFQENGGVKILKAHPHFKCGTLNAPNFVIAPLHEVQP